MTIAARACPACHTSLPEQAQFCLQCGHATPTDPGAPPRTAASGVVEVARVRSALSEHHRIARVLGEGGMTTEKALDYLEPLLRVPYHLSPGWLRIDPTFASLEGNPRFERLLAREAQAR